MLPRHLQDIPHSRLIDKIRLMLKPILGDNPLIWITSEFKERGDNYNKHLNIEILQTPKQTKAIRRAFKILYGLDNPGINEAIENCMPRRCKITDTLGLHYAILNRPGYSTKENARLVAVQQMMLKNRKLGERYTYISRTLTQAAAIYYNPHIFKK